MGILSAVWRVFYPRYVPLLLADVVYLVVLILTYERVTIEPGQGALKRVFIFPAYTGTYRTSDVVGSATATDPGLLLGNALLGLFALYVPINVLVNLVGPGPLRDWHPRNTYPITWGLVILLLLLGYVYAVLAGHGGMTLWYLAVTTTVVSIWIAIRSPSGSSTDESSAVD